MRSSDGADIRLIRIGSLVSLIAMLFFSACGVGESDVSSPPYDPPFEPPTAPSLASLQLSKPQSCQDNKNVLIDTWYEAYTRPAPRAIPTGTLRHVPPSPGWSLGGNAYQDTAKLVKGYSANSLVRNLSFLSFATTDNTQVVGLDGANQLKIENDGSIYIINNTTLTILQITPLEEMKVVASLELKFEFTDNGRTIERATPRRIFLDADRKQIVVVMTGNFYRPRAENNDILLTPPALDEQYESSPTSITGILAIDVSNGAKPVIRNEWLLEGDYVTTQQVGSRIAFVNNSPIAPPQSLMGDKNLTDAVTELQKAYTSLQDLDQAGLSQESIERQNAENTTRELVATYKRKIRSLVTEAVSAQDSSTLVPRRYTVINGKTDRAPSFECGSVFQPKIAFQYPRLLSISSLDLETGAIHTVPTLGGGGIVYSSGHNIYVVQNSDSWWRGDENTGKAVVYQFDLQNAAPLYVGAGVLNGHVREATSLSEHDGYLRIATSEYGRQGNGNNLYVMKMDSLGELTTTGQVSDFERGQPIVSVRFAGSRAYVATSTKNDGLVAFDVADPNQPKLIGVLKIPGLGGYMNPIDDHHILTVGNGLSHGVVIRSVRAQLFDVSNIEAPIQLSEQKLDSDNDWSSDFEIDKIFAPNYDPMLRALTVPHASYNAKTGVNKSELVVLAIDPNRGVTESGRMDHVSLAYTLICNKPPYGPLSLNGTTLSNNTSGIVSALCDKGANIRSRQYSYLIPQITGGFVWGTESDRYMISLSDIGVEATKLSRMSGAAHPIAFKDALISYAGGPAIVALKGLGL